MTWLWVLCAPALLLALASLAAEVRRTAYVRRRLGERPASLPPASIIVPVKGPDNDLRLNLAMLAAQDYPDCEVIITARTATDIPPGVLPSGVKVVVGRSDEPGTSEKIQNLMAGVKASRKRSQILAFADSDGRASPRWLRALAVPLGEAGVGAATGYRWHTPSPAGWWPLLRSVWDSVVAGSLGPGANRFAWGGSTAILKETFFSAHVPEFWKGAVSDDYRLSAAVRHAGLRIAFAPGAMAATGERVSASGLFSWTRRQLLLTRVHDPRLWWMALGSHTIYCVGMAAGAAALALHRLEGGAVLGLQLALGMAKGWNRARLARKAMPEHRAWFRRWGWTHTFLVPLITWLWLAALAGSAAGREIEWRGRRYRLDPSRNG